MQDNIQGMGDEEFEQVMADVMDGDFNDSVDESMDEEPQVDESTEDDSQEEINEEVVDTEGDESNEDGSQEEDDDLEETQDVLDGDQDDETEDDNPADNTEPQDDADKESPATDNDSDETDEEQSADETSDKQNSDGSGDKLITEILKPLKVSGKEVVVKSLDDARNLMQMGIDYSGKMRDVKPIRRIRSSLEEAGIINGDDINESKLALLVDASKGSKDAIAELLKINNIDPFDIEESDKEYVPETKISTEADIELMDVVKELQTKDSYTKVVDSIEDMDQKSQEMFLDNPRNMVKLQEDIESGTYDNVMQAVKYERMNGRLGDKSDMEAYIDFVSSMPKQRETEPEKVAPVAPVKQPSKSRRKAAGISKRPPAVKQQAKQYDYLAMPDDEFEALLESNSFNT